jgi:hypothetical protein
MWRNALRKVLTAEPKARRANLEIGQAELVDTAGETECSPDRLNRPKRDLLNKIRPTLMT